MVTGISILLSLGSHLQLQKFMRAKKYSYFDPSPLIVTCFSVLVPALTRAHDCFQKITLYLAKQLLCCCRKLVIACLVFVGFFFFFLAVTLRIVLFTCSLSFICKLLHNWAPISLADYVLLFEGHDVFLQQLHYEVDPFNCR